MKDGNQSKKTYAAPELLDFGKVTDVTKTGTTQTGSDGKGGSAQSPGE